MSLTWTEPMPANGKDCYYDHVRAETPFGRIQITWKSWKDQPSYSVDEFLGDHEIPYSFMMLSTLEEAKRVAEEEFCKRLAEARVMMEMP